MSIKSKSLVQSIFRNNPYFEDFITRNVYHSNKIEGCTLSYAETYAIIFKDKDHIDPKVKAREVYEAINLKYAYNYIMKNVDKEISLNMIKHIGMLINTNIKEIADFRKVQVFLGSSEYIPPRAEEVINRLSILVYKNGKKREESIYDYLARFHIEFERIHPFEDGNGRTGRVLITKELLSRNMTPIVITVDRRQEYMNYLERLDVKGMAKMFKELQEFEENRMEQFGIKI